MKMKKTIGYRLLLLAAISVWSVLIVVAAQRVGLVWHSADPLGWFHHPVSIEYVEESPENAYFESLNSNPQGHEKTLSIGD
jgi:hypothetical protein